MIKRYYTKEYILKNKQNQADAECVDNIQAQYITRCNRVHKNM